MTYNVHNDAETEGLNSYIAYNEHRSECAGPGCGCEDYPDDPAQEEEEHPIWKRFITDDVPPLEDSDPVRRNNCTQTCASCAVNACRYGFAHSKQTHGHFCAACI